MNIKQTIAAAAASIALSLAAGAALAHEGAGHKDADAPVKKEQQPWGIAGDAKSAKRTIEIAMSDEMRFTPSSIAVKQGETVRFVVSNKGKLLHEMVIGDRKTLDAHAALMARFPTMEHDEPYMAHVPSGKKETLVWTFNQPGEFGFACLITGHYQAGMAGKITVAQAQQAAAPAAQSAGPTVASPAAFTDGEVRKVDKDARKMTIKHGEIKNLDMPPMTMVFAVKDDAVLDKVKAGDKIQFKAVDDGGKLTVVEVEPSK